MKTVIATIDLRRGFFLKIINIFSDPEKRAELLQKIGVSVSSIVLIMALYTLMSDTFWLRFVKEFSEGLERIAFVKDEKGTNYRKTTLDTLWLPVTSSAHIYFGDTIKTGKEASVDIEINPKASFRVQAESLVRIKIVQGKPMIYLATGAIQTNFLEDQVILIKRGSRIEEIVIQQGSFLIKNDLSAGVQITEYTQDTKKAIGEKQKTQTKAKASKESDEIKDLKEEDLADSDGPIEDKSSSLDRPMVYHLPYPESGTVFLLKTPHSLLLAAKLICPDSCTMKVYRNQKLLFEMRSSINEPATTKINSEQLIPGYYDWSFTSEGIEHKAHFQVKDYSEENLSEALSKGQSVEIF